MPIPNDFRLNDGTVVDHLPVGTAARALALLGLPREGAVTIGMNVPSTRHGRKDIIRVEGLALKKSESDRLALFGGEITVSIVRGGEVKQKQVLEVPKKVEGILVCPNPTCITRIMAAIMALGVERARPMPVRFDGCLDASLSSSPPSLALPRLP